jgi:hypothetical protein
LMGKEVFTRKCSSLDFTFCEYHPWRHHIAGNIIEAGDMYVITR